MDDILLYFIIGILAALLIAFKILTEIRRPSKAEIKGIEGELKVANILKKSRVRHFNDVLLEIGPTSTQIDHLVVLPNKTILVVETKNMSGKIIGNADDRQWTQIFPNDTFKFYNPIKQNEGHIRFLNRFCDKHRLKGYNFINIVAFVSDRCDISQTPPNIVTLSQFRQMIKTFKMKKRLNSSKKFEKAIKLNDFSKNRKKVKQHLAFIESAKEHNKNK